MAARIGGRMESASTASPASAQKPEIRTLALWMLGMATMVFVIVVIGGITRLTEIGVFDHRIETDYRRNPAAERGRLGCRVREI